MSRKPCRFICKAVFIVLLFVFNQSYSRELQLGGFFVDVQPRLVVYECAVVYRYAVYAVQTLDTFSRYCRLGTSAYNVRYMDVGKFRHFF